jgi:hypothetical protein
MIYKGGTKELREAMAPSFIEWDFDGWDIADGYGKDPSEWRAMTERDIDHVNRHGFLFRRKPKTIKCGGVEFPEPNGEGNPTHWVDVSFGLAGSTQSYRCKGFRHVSEENAEAHFDALIAISKGEG